MEREISEFRQTREQQLQQQAMRMREGIVKEITEVVLERVKANGMDLVFDKSGLSTNYVPVVLYSRDNADFTSDIITALNKKSGKRTGKTGGRRDSARDESGQTTRQALGPFLVFESRRHAESPRVFCAPVLVYRSVAYAFEFERGLGKVVQ